MMSNAFHGIYRARVLSNADPEKRSRLQVQVPAVGGIHQSVWAEPSQPRGVIMTLPTVRQIVWVMYEGGDTQKPIWFPQGSDSTVQRPGTEPYAVVTMDTVQTVPAAKTFTGGASFTGAITVPAGAFPISATSGLQASLDSKYGPGGNGSPANPPPYPVTSVAGRLGAVTLSAADIAAGTFPGAFTFTGAVTAPSATIPTLTGPVNTTGNLSENGVRVVTATTPNLATTVVSETGWGVVTAVGVGTSYARSDHTHGSPPTPVTSLLAGAGVSVSAATGAVTVANTGALSVAGRTGAVVLTAADVGAGTFPGSYTVSGTLNVVGTLSNNGTPAVTSVATRTGAVTLTAADVGAGAFPAGATYSTTGQLWVNVDTANTGTTGINGLRVGSRAGLMSYLAAGTATNAATYLTDNLYYTGTGWAYTNTSTSLSHTLGVQAGGLTFASAPANAGVAGAAATLTNRFSVDASGNASIFGNASISGTAMMGYLDMASVRGTGFIGTSDWLNISNNSAYIPHNTAGTPDFNTLENRISGFYTDANTVNNPLGSNASWWNVMQVRHQNLTNNYGFQLASQMTGPSGLYYRAFQGGSGTDATVPGGTWYRVYTEEYPPMKILGGASNFSPTTAWAAAFTFVAPASGLVRITAQLFSGAAGYELGVSINGGTVSLGYSLTPSPGEYYLNGLSAGATYTVSVYSASGAVGPVHISAEG